MKITSLRYNINPQFRILMLTESNIDQIMSQFGNDVLDYLFEKTKGRLHNYTVAWPCNPSRTIWNSIVWDKADLTSFEVGKPFQVDDLFIDDNNILASIHLHTYDYPTLTH